MAAANNHTSVVEKLVNFRTPINSAEEVTMHITIIVWVCVDAVVVAVYIHNWETCKVEWQGQIIYVAKSYEYESKTT